MDGDTTETLDYLPEGIRTELDCFCRTPKLRSAYSRDIQLNCLKKISSKYEVPLTSAAVGDARLFKDITDKHGEYVTLFGTPRSVFDEVDVQTRV